MAVTYPFDFPERYGNKEKISKEQEITTWVDMQDTINDLRNRCNLANATHISEISLINQNFKQGPMSAYDYDYNIDLIKTSINQIIQASENQGLNPLNTVSLHKRSGQNYPLLLWQRDSNFRTIQTVINSIHYMYLWIGC